MTMRKSSILIVIYLPHRRASAPKDHHGLSGTLPRDPAQGPQSPCPAMGGASCPQAWGHLRSNISALGLEVPEAC